MNYKIKDDLKLIREFFGLSQADLAKAIDVDRLTISRVENGDSYPRIELMDKVYGFCYEKGLRLNAQKEMLYKDDLKKGHMLLTHASKEGIEGNISLNKGKRKNDFGPGFYCGDSYDKSISFVSRYAASSVYFIDFDPAGLKHAKFDVSTDWMITIAYWRGILEGYEDRSLLRECLEHLNDIDYVIAPIADNRMFQIIDTFIAGEITDEQCKHCLAATNLGMQYVFLSDKAIGHLSILERCFLSTKEKEHSKLEHVKFQKDGEDKSKLARINYRGKGKYIEEIIK